MNLREKVDWTCGTQAERHNAPQLPSGHGSELGHACQFRAWSEGAHGLRPVLSRDEYELLEMRGVARALGTPDAHCTLNTTIGTQSKLQGKKMD